MDLVKRHYSQSMPKLLQGAPSTMAGQGQGLREVLAMGLPAAREVRLTHAAGAPQPCTHPTHICNLCLFSSVHFYSLL